MSKTIKKIIAAVIVLAALGIYYYVTIPAVNIHSAGFWQCLLFFIAAVTVCYVLAKTGHSLREKGGKPDLKEAFGSLKLAKAGIALFLLVLAVYLAGSILSSPIVNASKYQELLTVEYSDFS